MKIQTFKYILTRHNINHSLNRSIFKNKINNLLNCKNNLLLEKNKLKKINFKQFTTISSPTNESKNPPTQMTNAQMMEKLKNVTVYKRIMPKLGIPFSSRKSQELLKESIEEGSANSYFHLADQFQTQSDPTFCGPTTMICIFNSLGVDPRKKWKGIWRWYLEEIIKCLDLNKTKDYGMTLEEYALISKCNGVFTQGYRPDNNELDTENKILSLMRGWHDKINNTENVITSDNIYENKNNIINHDTINNSECKNNFEIKIRQSNLDFFRACVYASTRRDNFYLVTNTSRKALKQTGEGHFSPVAAFNIKNDQLLLLDAARFKYNSMWFTLPMTFNSFFNIDKCTEKFRGFILCSRYYYHNPRMCKSSLDLESSGCLTKFYNKINHEFVDVYINKFNTNDLNLENYFKIILKNIKLLLDYKIKSLLIYYNHDIENRCSFHLTEEYLKDFIKYKNDNLDITKEIIFNKEIKKLSLIFNKIIMNEINISSNILIKDFLKFLYYLDNSNFLNFFTFFVVSNFDKFVNKNKFWINLEKETNLLFVTNIKDKLNMDIQKINNDEIVAKEIKILQDILGL